MAPITFAVRQGVLACQDVVEGRAFDYEEEEQVLATRRRERADAYAALRQEARLAAATAEEERLAALGHSYNSVNKARTAVAPRIDEARARQGRTLRDAEDADDRWEREHGARISVLSGERNGTRVYDRLARQRERPPLPGNFRPQHGFDNGFLKVRDEKLGAWPRTEEVVRDQLAEYYGLIEHLDAAVGRVLDAVDAIVPLDRRLGFARL